jgi:DNA polymerase I-like protein with 3'-5' exonuclease and polymerase domains
MEIFTDQINQDSPQLYNALDTMLTAEVFSALEQLPKDDPIYNFELSLQAPVIEMQLRGIRVDTLKLGDLSSKLKRDRTIIEAILKKFVTAAWDKPWSYNKNSQPTFPNSNTQLIDFFYNTIGLKKITQKVKGEFKTPMDREILEKLSVHFQTRPIISLILAYRDICGKLEVLEAGVDSDSRMRCSINIAATTTGRFSTSQSTTGSGQNLQNVTEDLRHIFISDPYHKICALDKEQAESREFGYLCGVLFDDWSYLNAIESGDIHTYCCRLIWPNLPWTGNLKLDRKIAEQPFYRHLSYRDMTKRCGHGTSYYGKPYTIANEIKVPIKFVQDFQEAFFKAFPCIRLMHYWVKEQLQTKGYLINVFGRRRDFFDRLNSDETLRAAIAYLFQSATADDMNLGLWRLWRYFPRAQLLLQLHDAIYFQFEESFDEEETITQAQKLLDVKLHHKGREFIVPTDPLVGFNLGHRFKLDDTGQLQDVNPKGLDKVKWN